MNKKGFASSVIIYTIFAIFLVAISIMLFTVNNSVALNKALNEGTLNNISYGSDSVSDLEERIAALESTIVDKIYPVGSIYISAEDDTVEKVKERFGGEWEAYSKGTTLVGSGTYTDSNGNVATYTVNGKQEGSNLVKLTTENLPSHSHSISHTHTYSGTTAGSGSHTHSFSNGGNAIVVGSNVNHTTYADGFASFTNGGWWNQTNKASSAIASVANHTHTYSGTTKQASTTTSGLTGSGTAFNAHDPYITVYMYKRVK